MASAVIVGAQWGDEGKGKIVDFLAGQADFVVRFQGGDNAGHTVYLGDRKYVFHILPSGMLRPGVTCVIGSGVVLNLRRLADEISEVGISEQDITARLRISGETALILPCHMARDRSEESSRGKGRIGTTQRGIGPAYVDVANRTAVRMADTLDEDWFRKRLAICLESKRDSLEGSEFSEACDFEKTASETLRLARRFAPLVCDASALLEEARAKGKNLLFEGAQGTMLDVHAGTYPYVTSSNTVAGGACVGSGVGPRAIGRILGVAKAYTTRVGEGPFPTELIGETGERLRETGGEYGATTRRPRRCGWLDIVQLRRAVRLNSLDGIVLTKLDVLDGFDRIGVCTAYRVKGRCMTEWPVNPADLESVEPEIEFMPGWLAATSCAGGYDALPAAARNYVEAVEKWLGVPVAMVTAGKERDDIIVRQPVF
ncbi:MAG: adenylosuccinate synthase [Lentisphaerae bacterium]|nr:adenylosuccinate synthase [Lentisphaerota bacterium]